MDHPLLQEVVRVYARMNVFQGTAESIESALENLDDTAAAVRSIPGSKGLISVFDRDTGKSIGITLWESEEAMKASEDAARELREGIANTYEEQVVAVERYEVAFLEIRT